MGGPVGGFSEDIFDQIIVPLGTILLISMFPQEAIILAYTCDACESFMSEQIGITLGWIGIDDEDVISVQMQDQKLMEGNEEFYKNLMIQVAIEHQRSQMGIIDLLAIKSQGVRGSMNKYYKYGKDKYLYGEPTTTINTISIDPAAVDVAITTERGISVDVMDIEVRVPKEVEWVNYKLTALYGYNPTSQVMTYTGLKYTVSGFVYNYGTGKYDVAIGRECAQQVTTTKTVTNIDTTTDNVHTVVRTVVTAYDGVISDTTSASDLAVPIGTVTGSVVVVDSVVVIDPVTLYIASYVPAAAYVVRYTPTGSSDEYDWVYFIGGSDTALNAARNYLTDLSMLPIVELRSNSINVNADVNSTKYKQTKEILNIIGIDADTMIDNLNSNPDIGAVTAAYIYFGAELGSNDPIQSKLIYRMIEFMYYDPTLVNGSTHTIKVEEGVYNSSISWQRQERYTVTRTGVAVGTHEGGVSYDSMMEPVYDIDGVTILSYEEKKSFYAYVRRQETASSYVEYRLYNVSAITLIQKGAMYDVSISILEVGKVVVFPISTFFLNGLTPIEQGIVFPEVLRMVTYSADIQHLRYYQTAAFANLIQIVMVIVAIVIFIFTWWSGPTASIGFMSAVEGLLYGVVVAYALQQLLLMTDNPALKAVLIALVIAVMAYNGGGNIDYTSLATYTADMITTAVTQYSDQVLSVGYAALGAAAMAFSAEATIRQEEIDEANKTANQSLLSTSEVERLTKIEDMKGYVEGVDLSRYKAGVDFMCNWDLVKSMSIHTDLYNYDKHFRLGVAGISS